MLAHPTPAPPNDPPDPSVADAQHYRTLLHELLDLGMDHARFVHAEAKTLAAAPEPAPNPAAAQAALAVAHDRIARAIRRTITLARHLDDPVTPSAAQHRASSRRRIIRAVEDTIDREPRRPDKDHLRAELAERLEGPDLDADILHRPIPEIIAEICRDLALGVMPGQHLHRRTPSDIAALCARAARPPAPPITLAPPAPSPPAGDPAADRPDAPERLYRLIATPNGA
jgi:hypothetical protein